MSSTVWLKEKTEYNLESLAKLYPGQKLMFRKKDGVGGSEVRIYTPHPWTFKHLWDGDEFFLLGDKSKIYTKMPCATSLNFNAVCIDKDSKGHLYCILDDTEIQLIPGR